MSARNHLIRNTGKPLDPVKVEFRSTGITLLTFYAGNCISFVLMATFVISWFSLRASTRCQMDSFIDERSALKFWWESVGRRIWRYWWFATPPPSLHVGFGARVGGRGFARLEMGWGRWGEDEGCVHPRVNTVYCRRWKRQRCRRDQRRLCDDWLFGF